MRKSLLLASFAVAAAMFLPAAVHAADPAEAYAGKVLIDVSSHGEAWYVNPQSRMRVYLGRPQEALSRLAERAVRINFGQIARIAEEAGGTSDETYAADRAGYVLQPNDLIGAAWYVHPVLKTRMRLATSDDAWQVMRTGIPVTKTELKAIGIEPETVKPPTGSHTVKKIETADTLTLDDGSKVRLISVDVPANPDMQEAAMTRLAELTDGKSVLVESDVQDEAADGAKMRFLHAAGVNLNYDLVRNGLAFHNVAFPNFKYGEMMIVGGLDAMQQKRGMWNK